jgi:hypothetical protein
MHHVPDGRGRDTTTPVQDHPQADPTIRLSNSAGMMPSRPLKRNTEVGSDGRVRPRPAGMAPGGADRRGFHHDHHPWDASGGLRSLLHQQTEGRMTGKGEG